MSYSMWGAIAETSWWIYLLFLWLGVLAWKATKPQTVHATLTIASPLASIITLVILLPVAIHLTPAKTGWFALAMLPGFLTGYVQMYFRGIKTLKQEEKFYIPGSWGVFILLFILVFLKFYYYEYAVNLNLDIFHKEKPSTILVALCGFSIGLQGARAGFLYQCLKKGPFMQSAH